MSDSVVDLPVRGLDAERASDADDKPLPLIARHGLALVMVAVTTALAYGVRPLAPGPSLTLIFVLPVVIAATTLGWGPSLLAAVAGTLAFDFFFTSPYFSLAIDSASDVWAAGLLLVIGAIVSTVAADARRRALEAKRAAEQAEALQALAHAILEGRPRVAVLEAAAKALQRIFQAPSVVLMARNDVLAPVAAVGGADLTSAERDAAHGVLTTGLPARAETYPYGDSRFDFWPVTATGGAMVVLGVRLAETGARAKAAERFFDLVGSYLAIGLGGPSPVEQGGPPRTARTRKSGPSRRP